MLRQLHLRLAAGLLAVGGLLGLMACSSNGTAASGAGKINVVAAFYPLQFVAERVGGDAVPVSSLAKPGAEPHDLELQPQQMAQIADARLVVFVKGFQPAVDEAVAREAQDSAFDVAAVRPGTDGTAAQEPGDETAAGDPHVWLDPIRLATIADRLADRLGSLDPARAGDYRARAATLRQELQTLDKEYSDGLRTCQRREIVTSHAAFGHLAARYRLEQIPVTGITPEEEPSPQRLAEIAAQAREHGVTTIFFETLVSPKVAEAVAREVGARTAVLDPIEGLRPGSTEDYPSLMRANLAALKPALGCT